MRKVSTTSCVAFEGDRNNVTMLSIHIRCSSFISCVDVRIADVKAIKTYIRTKSGRLVERIIFLSEEDYAAFKEGKNVQDILKKYLSKDEAQGLESWDKDEVKAIKTYVRTKSGRLVEKLVYVSKEDYDAITQGKGDAKALLKKYAKDGEVIEGWDEAKMKTIKKIGRAHV